MENTLPASWRPDPQSLSRVKPLGDQANRIDGFGHCGNAGTPRH